MNAVPTIHAQADRAIALSVLQSRRAQLERAINELEFDIRELCEKQKCALALVHQIEELIAGEAT